MIKHQLDVTTDSSIGALCWTNLKRVVETVDGEYIHESVFAELKHYNGKNVCGTRFIEFETAEDLAYFVLKFS
jgi:hypothetical protein